MKEVLTKKEALETLNYWAAEWNMGMIDPKEIVSVLRPLVENKRELQSLLRRWRIPYLGRKPWRKKKKWRHQNL